MYLFDLQNASIAVKLFVISYSLLVLTIRSSHVHLIFCSRIESGPISIQLTNNE